MVSQEQIKENYHKILEIKDLLFQMEQKHDTATFTFLVGSEEKTLPPSDVDAIIEDYKQLKSQVQDKFKELL